MVGLPNLQPLIELLDRTATALERLADATEKANEANASEAGKRR
jgi:hypothetical protein